MIQQMSFSNDHLEKHDCVVPQNWADYSPAEHNLWAHLFKRQTNILKHRAVPEYFQGIKAIGLDANQIPNFDDLSERLLQRTNWQIVAVLGLIPEEIFFNHLAHRRFPATRWIRKPEQIDYLQEPDIFHDIYGHVPLLALPAFADYMQAYGEIAQRSFAMFGTDIMARLYWYTVEFGLIESSKGLKIYGSGIVSSKAESVYCLESSDPHRIYFDLQRVLNTDYIIDHFQKNYFIIKSFDELLKLVELDWVDHYKNWDIHNPIPAGHLMVNDRLYSQ